MASEYFKERRVMTVYETAKRPRYSYISANRRPVQQRVASGELKPGDKLPTIRQLAQSLKVNQNTVLKAYCILEQETVITSKRGFGTIITDYSDKPDVVAARQRYLSDTVCSDLMKVLSLGYSPEEVKTAFHLHLQYLRSKSE